MSILSWPKGNVTISSIWSTAANTYLWSTFELPNSRVKFIRSLLKAWIFGPFRVEFPSLKANSIAFRSSSSIELKRSFQADFHSQIKNMISLDNVSEVLLPWKSWLPTQNPGVPACKPNPFCRLYRLICDHDWDYFSRAQKMKPFIIINDNQELYALSEVP